MNNPMKPASSQPTNDYEVLVFELQAELSRVRDSAGSIKPAIKYDTIEKEVYIYLPRRLYTFTDSSTYKAVISAAAKPTIESMEVYKNTIYTTKLYKSTYCVDVYYDVFAYRGGFDSAIGVVAKRKIIDRLYMTGFLQQSLSGNGVSCGVSAAITVLQR